jgi:hypothetical protein
MKKQIEVVMNGLNELGVKEANEFYKDNISCKYCSKFKLGDRETIRRTKRIKMIKGFGPETVLFKIDLKQHIIGNKYGGGWFEVKVKHLDCKIYEVELIEKFTEINLEG